MKENADGRISGDESLGYGGAEHKEAQAPTNPSVIRLVLSFTSSELMIGKSLEKLGSSLVVALRSLVVDRGG